MKNCDNFLIFAQNIDYRVPTIYVSDEYPQSMFESINKKIMYTPVNPGFTIYKWGVRGCILHGHVSMM